MTKMLDNIVLFTQLVENKSFTKTAEQSNMSQPTLSKKMAELENYIGTTLLVHSTRKFELTIDGEILYHKFKHLRKYLKDNLRQLRKEDCDSSGELTVSLAAVFAYELICPYIDQFIIKHPNIKLNLIFQQNLPEMNEHEINVAISNHIISDDNYECAYLRTEIAQLYCTPEYVKQYGIPRTIEEFADHRFIGVLDNHSKKPARIVKLKNRTTKQETIFDNLKSIVRVNLVSHMKQIGMYGNYIFGCWGCLCDEDVRRGRLIPVLPDYEEFSMDFYLITNKSLSVLESYFVDFIYRCMTKSVVFDKLYQYQDFDYEAENIFK